VSRGEDEGERLVGRRVNVRGRGERGWLVGCGIPSLRLGDQGREDEPLPLSFSPRQVSSGGSSHLASSVDPFDLSRVWSAFDLGGVF
jgi:hypothetical protein